jgi:hypothetical protein
MVAVGIDVGDGVGVGDHSFGKSSTWSIESPKTAAVRFAGAICQFIFCMDARSVVIKVVDATLFQVGCVKSVKNICICVHVVGGVNVY